MFGLIRELRHVVRSLARRPVFVIMAVTTLSLGIGASTTVFTVVKGVLLKPLPFRDGHRIVWIWGTTRNDDAAPTSVPDFIDLRQQADVFDWCAIFSPLTGQFGEDPTRVSGLGVSAGFFEVFGVDPLLGRTFLPSEEHGDARYRVVILSQGLWERRFGADRSIVGKTIDLNGKTPVAVGVMPKWFGALPTKEASRHRYEFWVPLNLDQRNFQLRSVRVFSMAARLKPSVSLDQAEVEMGAISSYLGQTYPETNRGRGLRLERARLAVVGDVEPLLYLLVVAVVVVLLIACCNVANLLLARAIGREGEVAIRLTLGGRWWAVFRQLLWEALLLSLVGGVAGFVLGIWGVRVLVALSPNQISRLNEVAVDGTVAGFALGLSLVVSLLVAALPTFRTSRTELSACLQRGGLRGRGQGSRRGLSNTLVVVEVALAVVLMTSGVAMLKNLQRLLRVDPGFDADRIVTAWVDVFSPELLERLESLTGVESAGAVSVVPIGSPRASIYELSLSVEGKADEKLGEHNFAFVREATPGYFGAMGIPLVSGSLFSPSDGTEVAIISQSMANWIWPGEDPTGRRITINAVRPFQVRIVGVVGDVRQVSLERSPWQDIYIPWTARRQRGMDIVVRGGADLVAPVQAALSGARAGNAPPQVRRLEEGISQAMAGRRFVIWLLGVFATIATFLALVGVYGSLSYWVSTQVPGLAMRTALGARQWDLVKLVLARCLRLTVSGVVIGLTASVTSGLFVGGRLSGVRMVDPASYAVAIVGFALLSVAAGLGPALWAAKVDPSVALRSE